MNKTDKETISFLEGEKEPYYTTEAYTYFKTKVRKEKWGLLSFQEICKFDGNDIYFFGFVCKGKVKKKEFWPEEAFKKAPKYMYKILKSWKENPPKKEILNDFSRQLNNNTFNRKSFILINLFRNVGKTILSPYDYESLDSMKNDYDWQANNTLTEEEGLDTLKILIYYNIELDRERLFKFLLNIKYHNMVFIEKAKVIIDEAIAGRKIAKYIINQLDDEFVLSPLRKRIERRRFEDLIS